MSILKLFKKIGKGLLIFLFVIFVFVPFFDFWVRYPFVAGTLILVIYLIVEWIEGCIKDFKKKKKSRNS